MVAEIMTIILEAIWNNIDNSFNQKMITMWLNVLAVLDNGLVHLHALVGGEVLDSGLVCLQPLVGEEIYQLADGSDHALHHGRRPCGDAWRARLVLSRQPASDHARVVFDMTRQWLHFSSFDKKMQLQECR